MAANGERIGGELGIFRYNPTERDHLAVILLRILHDVPIPQRIVCVCQPNDRRIDIKRQRIFDFVVLHLAIGVLIGDIRPAADTTDDLVEFHLVHRLLKAVEYHQFAGVQLIHHQTAHISVVLEEGSGICKKHLLIYRPVIRQILEQVVHGPHTVVFQNDTGRPTGLEDFLQILRIEVLLILNGVQKHVLARKGGNVVFLLALLTEQQQCGFAGVETLILHGFLNELGLSRL